MKIINPVRYLSSQLMLFKGRILSFGGKKDSVFSGKIKLKFSAQPLKSFVLNVINITVMLLPAKEGENVEFIRSLFVLFKHSVTRIAFFAQFLSQDSNLNFPALCNQLYSHFAHFAVLKFSNFYLLLEI